MALFVTGGGGITGGIDIPSQLPSPWVSRSQEHIVVTINYRVNIFGSEIPSSFSALLSGKLQRIDMFSIDPKSRALNETSLTILDVRAAVEWVYNNIEAFGGDAGNIMVPYYCFSVAIMI